MINYKLILRPILRLYLKFFAKIALLINKPVIIVVAGSMNKHFAKQAITKSLQELNLSVRAGIRGYNTDIGLPLSILNLPSGYNSYKNWKYAIKEAPLACIKETEKILVLEFGISEPNDIAYLLSVVNPQIVIITDITQRHIENFRNVNAIAREYELLATSIPKKGLLIANLDNLLIKKIINKSSAKVKTFGQDTLSSLRIDGIALESTGQSVIIKQENQTKEVFIKRFGLHHVYAHCAAILTRDYFKNHEKSIKEN